MKKVILITMTITICCIICFGITSCRKSATKTNKTTTTIADTEVVEKEKLNKESELLDSITKNEKSKVIKKITNRNKELKSIILTKNNKDKLIKMFLKRDFVFCTADDIDFTIPHEIRITEKWDDYDSLGYSVYEYNNEKFYAFLIREKFNPQRSTFYSLKTVYDNYLVIPMDKVYSIDDFKGIVINESDLSDVKKVYKYADVLLKQEIELENSKKECSINIMSKDSGITITFKKSGDKYIVTKIKNGAKDTCVSMIADVDKNFKTA